jgi:hypothetical protein
METAETNDPWAKVEEWKRACYKAEAERDQLRKDIWLLGNERDNLYAAILAMGKNARGYL